MITTASTFLLFIVEVIQYFEGLVQQIIPQKDVSICLAMDIYINKIHIYHESCSIFRHTCCFKMLATWTPVASIFG